MEKLKRTVINILLVLLMFTLQTGLFERISLGGIVPNLMLIYVAAMGLMNDEYLGMLAGFACGLLSDIFFMSFIGYHALLYTYIGYFAGYCHKYYFPQDIRLPAAVFAGCDLLQSVITYILFFLLNGEFDFGYYLVHIIFAELIYTIGVSVVLYPLLMLLEFKVIREPLLLCKKEKKDA